MSTHENIYDFKDEVVPVVKDKYDVGTFSFVSVYSVLLFSFLMFNNVWLIATTVNVEMHEDLINVLNNVSAILIVIMVNQMYKFQESWTDDIGQVRRACSRLNYE